jgi:hypothetical protein
VIVIPLQMWQFGYEDRQWNIGTIVIFNDGTGTQNRGNYVCRTYKEGEWEKKKNLATPIREGKVSDWPRNSRPVFELVIAGLHACGYRSRKKDEQRAEELPSSGSGEGSVG